MNSCRGTIRTLRAADKARSFLCVLCSLQNYTMNQEPIDYDDSPMHSDLEAVGFAELYDLAFSTYGAPIELASVEKAWTIAHRQPPARVADLGSGTGIYSTPLAQSGVEVWSIEPDPSMALIQDRKIARLPSRQRQLIHRYERLSLVPPTVEVDSVIMMTDTLSYIWPRQFARQTIKHVSKLLAPSGTLLIDIALWNDDDWNRQEEWTNHYSNLVVRAACNCVVIPAPPSIVSNGQWRIEELLFRCSPRQGSARKVSALNAFSFADLDRLLADEGFLYFGFITPEGSRISVGSTPRRLPRAILIYQVNGQVT